MMNISCNLPPHQWRLHKNEIIVVDRWNPPFRAVGEWWVCNVCGLEVYVHYIEDEGRVPVEQWWGRCPGFCADSEVILTEWRDFYVHCYVAGDLLHWQERLGGKVEWEPRRVEHCVELLWTPRVEEEFSCGCPQCYRLFVTRKAFEEVYGPVEAFRLYWNGDVRIWTPKYIMGVAAGDDGVEGMLAIPRHPEE